LFWLDNLTKQQVQVNLITKLFNNKKFKKMVQELDLDWTLRL